jgi:hypothetical protein
MAYDEALADREMRGWLHVSEEALESDEDLASWVERGVNHAQELPPGRIPFQDPF